MANSSVRTSTLLTGAIISAMLGGYYLFILQPTELSSVLREPRNDIRWINTVPQEQSPPSFSDTKEQGQITSHVAEKKDSRRKAAAKEPATEKPKTIRPPAPALTATIPASNPQAKYASESSQLELSEPEENSVQTFSSVTGKKRETGSERDHENPAKSRVQAARIIEQPHPRYPFSARRRNIEGWVIVSYGISKDGKTQNLQIVDAYPVGLFENSSIEAVRKWVYEPKKIDGIAVEEKRVKSRINFTLN